MNKARITHVAGLSLLLAAIITVLLGPLGSRIGWWNYYFAVTLFKYAAAVALAGFTLLFSGLLMSKKKNRRKIFTTSLLTLALVIPTTGTLLYWKSAKQKFPPIQDISTDLFEPPEFWYVPNTKIYNPLAVTDLQMEAYPDVEPVTLNLPFDQAYQRAYKVILDTGWEINAAEPEAGRIEATDTTFWFGFSDDVVIRVTREGSSSVIDIRSASRFGSGGDGGTNAKRVMRIITALQQQEK